MNLHAILTFITVALVSLVSWTNGLMTAGSSRDCCLGRANTRCGGIAVQWKKKQEKVCVGCFYVEAPLCYHLTSSVRTRLSHFSPHYQTILRASVDTIEGASGPTLALQAPPPNAPAAGSTVFLWILHAGFCTNVMKVLLDAVSFCQAYFSLLNKKAKMVLSLTMHVLNEKYSLKIELWFIMYFF